MTISKLVFQEIATRFPKSFYPQVRKDDTTNETIVEPLPEKISTKQNIQIIVNDFLGYLRNVPIDTWIDKSTLRPRKATCLSFIKKLTDQVLEDLHNYSDVKIYIICLDPYGRRRPEKAATTLKRIKPTQEGAPEILTIPRGQTRFFEDDEEMPAGKIDIIFNTPAAKIDFYRYFTDYLRSIPFRAHIPVGKCVILSGGLDRENTDPIPPLKISMLKYEYMHEYSFPTLSEGDLDVWRWVNAFPTQNIHVLSYDGDVLLIGLHQTKNIIRYSDKSREIWFGTRRSIGSDDQSESQIKRKAALKEKCAETYAEVLHLTSSIDEAYRASSGIVPSFSSSSSSSSSSSTSTPRKQVVWLTRYVNMFNLYYEILADAKQLVYEANLTRNRIDHPKEFQLHNPVSSYILVLCLSSDNHDYINTKLISNKCNSIFVWRSFCKNLVYIGDLVQIYSLKNNIDDYHSTTNSQSQSSSSSSFSSSSSSKRLREEINNDDDGNITEEDNFDNIIEIIDHDESSSSSSSSSLSNENQKKQRTQQTPSSSSSTLIGTTTSGFSAFSDPFEKIVSTEKKPDHFNSQLLSILPEVSNTDIVKSFTQISKENQNDAKVFPLHHYVIDVQALTRLVFCIYEEKAHDSLKLSKKNNTEEKLAKARQEKTQALLDTVGPSEEDIQVVAAQCAWTLQYWGNGICPTYNITDGLMTIPDPKDNYQEKSIYGYCLTGWASNVIHANYRVAPPHHSSLSSSSSSESQTQSQ